MAELLLVNPTRAKGAKRKKGTPAMRRNKKGQFVKTHKNPIETASAPRKRRRYTRAVKAVKRTYRRAAKGAKRVYRRARRSIGGSSITHQVTTGVMGGVGLLAIDLLQNRLSMLPVSLQVGTGRQLTKAALGIGAGLLISKALKKPALGSIIASTAIATAVRDTVAERMPGYFLPMVGPAPASTTGEYMLRSGLGEYFPNAARRVVRVGR